MGTEDGVRDAGDAQPAGEKFGGSHHEVRGSAPTSRGRRLGPEGGEWGGRWWDLGACLLFNGLLDCQPPERRREQKAVRQPGAQSGALICGAGGLA